MPKRQSGGYKRDYSHKISAARVNLKFFIRVGCLRNCCFPFSRTPNVSYLLFLKLEQSDTVGEELDVVLSSLLGSPLLGQGIAHLHGLAHHFISVFAVVLLLRQAIHIVGGHLLLMCVVVLLHLVVLRSRRALLLVLLHLDKRAEAWSTHRLSPTINCQTSHEL